MSTDIVLERETANDETALVVAIHAASGTAVEPGTLLFEAENSKVTQEVEAPVAGIVVHRLEIGQTLEFGVAIARIVSAEAWEANGDAPAPTGVPQAAIAQIHREDGTGVHSTMRPERTQTCLSTAEPRFSLRAASLVAELGLQPSLFTQDFVIARDVLAYVGHGSARHEPAAAAPASAPQPTPARPPYASGEGREVPAHKRIEIEVLGAGAGSSMLSVLGADLGPLRILRSAGHIFTGRITDLAIYESARLMRKYPRLNAFYADGRVVEHADIHAGIAIDSGNRLMVYGIEHAERVGLPDLADIITDAVGRYMNNELSSADVSRATFTVTDLSADELSFVLPLLPRGQSCILGITRTAEAGYRIFAGFDHRVTEGREVAAFLGELCARIKSFSAPANEARTTAECTYCDRSLLDATTRHGDKGLMRIVDRHGNDAFCCVSCWNGW